MKLKNFLISSFLIVGIGLLHHPVTSHAIEYEEEWETSWGGNGDDSANAIIQTSDGGFLVIGSSTSTDLGIENKGKRDMLIVKFDSAWRQEWVDVLGGTEYDNAMSVIETDEGDFIVVGFSHSSNAGFSSKGRCDAVFIKYTRDGHREWVKNWGGSRWDAFYSVVKLDDGGFLAIGSSDSTNAGFANKGEDDVVLIKYDLNGNQEWVKNWGGRYFDEPSAATKTSDGGVVVVGRTASWNTEYIDQGFILKVNEKGEVEWEEVFKGNDYDYLETVKEVSDGGFITTGYSCSTNLGFENQGSCDAILVKYSVDGTQEWIRAWGGDKNEFFNDFIETKDGGILAVGSAGGSSPNYEGVIIKFDSEGQEEWKEIWENMSYNGIELVLELEDNKIGIGSFVDSGFSFNTYHPKKDSDVQINGTIQTMVADVTIPSVSPDLVINPNLSEGFVAPEFSVSNDSVSPIRLELKTFEQTTNTFNDVLPTKYDTWIGLNKQQSQDIALGLVAKEGFTRQTHNHHRFFRSTYFHKLIIIKRVQRLSRK